MAITINERAGLEYDARFFDSAKRPALPATAHWRLDCETTGRVLQDWTELAVQSSTGATGLVTSVFALIEIDGSLNAIQSNKNARELKTLLIVANKDLPREYSVNPPYQYYVRNNRGRL